jgi:hypothetical protein
MIETFFALVDPRMHHRSGSVFYSGRSAFEQPSDIYILGLNPGGDPVRQADETIVHHMQEALVRPSANWSAYLDESWNGRPAGTYGMQPRIRHLLLSFGLHSHSIPASNVVFVRSAREADLKHQKQQLLEACWPVHQAVIDTLGVKNILCLGATAGGWVREALDAHTLCGMFRENNLRRWKSDAHLNHKGQCVLTLTHPSIAAWNSPEADPSQFVLAMMKRQPFPRIATECT